MTGARIHQGTLQVSFTLSEKLAGLVRDIEVPLESIRSVEVVPHGLAAVRGLRAPGLALPRRRKIGTWRRIGSKELVAVRHGRPALRIELDGHRYRALLLDVDAPEQLAPALTAATGLSASSASGRSVRDIDLVLDSAGHRLAGTLTVPTGAGPFPAAVLLPGSGPVDRDSNHRRLRLDITRQLATALAGAGVATLRYDKRGVGGSEGSWRRAGFFDNVNDARAALDVLLSRPEVDRDRAFLVGHSEGALLATALAGRGAPVAGLVLLSPSATPGDEVMVWQAAQIAQTLPAAVRALLRLLRVDLVGKVRRNHARVRATTTDEARIGAVKVNARWHRELLDYDPRTDLARVAVPVLAVTGDKDLQVNPADLEVIRRLVPSGVATRLVPDVTHVLRAQPGPPSLSRYKKEVRRPIDQRVLDHVLTWIGERSAGAR